jgi:hypothetical protein
LKEKLLRKGIVIGIIMVFVGSCVIPSAHTKINTTSDSCDIPTWYSGDEWIYTADPVSYYSKNGSFNGKIENLKREMQGVTTITHDDDVIWVYQVKVSGDITGELSWLELSGDLEGKIEGVSYIRITDLAEVKTEIVSTGTVQILFITQNYKLTNSNLFFPPVELYDFPLKVDDTWEISILTSSSGSFILGDLIEEEFSSSNWLNETIHCSKKEVVSVGAGDFECFTITYSSDTFWYSPEVGNIVKSEVDQRDRDYTFNMDLSLESFFRSAQPINVTENIDPFEAIIGQEIIISGQAVDSNSDPIQNRNISIEIPRIGENWITKTDDDGYYSLTLEAPYMIDDTPSVGEFGSDGVVVRCSYDGLEGYKIKTLLIIDNFPPEPPTIKGPTSGKKRIKYDYEFLSPDPEDDDLYYFVEWGDDTNSGWEGPYHSGQPMILNHTWNEKGTFTIRAKAKDALGSESMWTDLEVTMPKGKQSKSSDPGGIRGPIWGIISGYQFTGPYKDHLVLDAIRLRYLGFGYAFSAGLYPRIYRNRQVTFSYPNFNGRITTHFIIGIISGLPGG